ncbi:helicase [Rhizobium leguminosarum bv. viciae]|uniref:helicase-related protein n=1 Tax=Rhizobium leguminosarum TaxID=384 RepID=UPI001440E730|nr:helicase-related protein [Rhizobium leguminosarum]NKK96540.1 helicase [Rhizobium leguminosarum bv. viciae]
MDLIKNTGRERVLDKLEEWLKAGSAVDIMSPSLSLHAFAEVRELLKRADSVRLLLEDRASLTPLLFGGHSDIGYRNKLQSRWHAKSTLDWLGRHVQVRYAEMLPQSMAIVRNANLNRAAIGACSLTTEGLGITPGSRLGLVQATSSDDETADFSSWFQSAWDTVPGKPDADELEHVLADAASQRAPSLIYFKFLFEMFKDLGDVLDEERIVKSATGIRNTTVWKKLFKFQRDGVVGAIDKLERIGGCIIADSVGLGKTFEALAVIKYYELRNDRVLVLCPKRLRDNWTLYKANDRRNSLASDRFNYDVLNHTDLSRDGGTSGDIDLSHVNWGNYDLVVIDESHNFRNKATHRDRDTRYDHLMKRVIKAGVKTKVLMLSATPVNNRLADLKNQIAFITEGSDIALIDHGIPSIEATIRKAQGQFNRWLDLPESERRAARLMDMLGFDYFKLLDMLTIARSRKHVQRYYGTAETGQFPDRLQPINVKADVDLAGEFRPIREINNEIRRLSLGAYAPLRYVVTDKQEAYDVKYSTRIRGGESYFRQADREESLIHLMRVNLLKRMESSVASFALTIKRQLDDVNALLAKIEAHDESIDELAIDDVDIDDPAFETLLVGRKVKVLLQDVDRVRWQQDLIEDRNRLATLLSAARSVSAERDAKLSALKELITRKVQAPINGENRKILLFTAFADTADYLYRELAEWGRTTLGIHTAVVTGTGANKTTLQSLRSDMSSILSAFSPRSKERPQELAGEGEIDLLIGTDCISEGQNLQDCDFLVNYDIHWNPVRIIQRFGRVDRIGSTNGRIQLVNFWPNIELDEYLDLESRVSGRMVLLDVSATGEENVIEFQAGNQMNDLEYRRAQLQKMQDSVIDLEDLSSGVSIADLTLNDFRIDLAGYLRDHRIQLEVLPPGTYAVVSPPEDEFVSVENTISPGVIFCLRAVGEAAERVAEPGYPLKPHFVVHVSDEGEALLPYTRAKQVLDRLKKVSIGRDLPDAQACARFDKSTRFGRDMEHYQKLLSRAVASIAGKSEERAVASLFSPGGTHALKGEFAGINDFEVVAFLLILPETSSA